MATLMITGGKIGSIIGRRRAFAIGCVIYGAGSFTTALAPNLTVLIIGWSFLEGIGAALIMPAIVALVASNFAARGPAARLRPGAVRGSHRGGGRAADRRRGHDVRLWRYVFAGEVVIVLVILVLTRRDARTPPPERALQLDVVGAVLSAAGLGLAVFGVLRSGEWGWVLPEARRDLVAGLSPTVGSCWSASWCSGCSCGGSNAWSTAARSRWST